MYEFYLFIIFQSRLTAMGTAFVNYKAKDRKPTPGTMFKLITLFLMVQEEVEGGKNLEKEEVITNADSEPIDSV